MGMDSMNGGEFQWVNYEGGEGQKKEVSRKGAKGAKKGKEREKPRGRFAKGRTRRKERKGRESDFIKAKRNVSRKGAEP